METNQPNEGLLPANPNGTHPGNPKKVAIRVTETLKAICKKAADETRGRVSETEWWYVYGVARGRVQTAELYRIALVCRRSPYPATRHALWQYVRDLAEDQTVLPLERAILRETIEQGECDTAIERYRVSPCLANLEAAIHETADHSGSIIELHASLVAERAKYAA